MTQQRIEAKWIDAFADAIRLCGVGHGDDAAILFKSQVSISRRTGGLCLAGAHDRYASPGAGANFPV